MKKILIVDDEDNIRLVLSEFLQSRGFSVCEAKDGIEALDVFAMARPDAVLLDVSMPVMDGMEALSGMVSKDHAIPVIMLSAHADISLAVQAVKAGAYDFISKPPDFEEISIRLTHAIEKAQLRKNIVRLSNSVDASFSRLLGKGPEIRAVISQVHKVAPSQFSVIIQGETGTGKSTLAELIHNLSTRAAGPFVRVDISVIPETIIESELFGHAKGSFTGAHAAKKGYFENAAGGTVFIDELENMSLPVQSKLLTAVEQKMIYPMGTAKAVPVDFRLIAATNTDLSGLVRQRRFREDLFYRLSEFTIHLPPLRERREDICFLAERFCIDACEELKRRPIELEEGARELVLSYRWSGNIRELKNVMRRAVLLSPGDTIERDFLAGVLNISSGGANEMHSSDSAVLPLREVSSRAVTEAEARAIKQALTLSAGNKSKAASILQVDYKTLLTKIRLYSISRMA